MKELVARLTRLRLLDSADADEEAVNLVRAGSGSGSSSVGAEVNLVQPGRAVPAGAEVTPVGNTGTCLTCGTFHFMRDCPARRAADVRCFLCNQQGHMRWQCPQRGPSGPVATGAQAPVAAAAPPAGPAYYPGPWGYPAGPPLMMPPASMVPGMAPYYPPPGYMPPGMAPPGYMTSAVQPAASQQAPIMVIQPAPPAGAVDGVSPAVAAAIAAQNKAADQKRTGTFQKSDGERRGPLVCFGCKEEGHVRSRCPKQNFQKQG